MWEYVKGSEVDFKGYRDTTFQIRKRHDNGLKFGTDGKPSRADWLSDVIAERRHATDSSLQSRTNDANLQQEIRMGSGVAPGVHSGPVYDVVQRPAHYNQSDIECIIAERGARYGEFKDGASIMQQLKDVMKSAPKWERLKPSQKEALEMIQHKIGRILNGDPDYDDNWKDIAGYATLIVKELSK